MPVAQKNVEVRHRNCLSGLSEARVRTDEIFDTGQARLDLTSVRFRKDTESFFISDIWKHSIGTCCESGFWA